MPGTRPNQHIDEEGICNACRSFERRAIVDWPSRAVELEQILARFRSTDQSRWDCVVPVSGGKDSTFQVVKMLQNGMNPLCVTAITCDLTDIGRRNIENVKSLGVDYIEVTTNPVVRRKMNRIGLKEIGDVSWPEHASIFTIPVRAAVEFNVPLIIWGENSQNEYGGPAADSEKNYLDRRWLEEFGGLQGLRVSDFLGQDGIEKKHLIPFVYPSDEEMKRVGVTGLFLGHYIPWDGFTNVLIAQGHGFESYHKNVEGSAVNYENLDNYQTGIHDYFKYLKFGFGRATDLVSLHIRRGRLSRAEGMDIVKIHDGMYPHSYLGKSLADILAPLEISVSEFQQICDRFTNKKIFQKDSAGNLVRGKDGRPLKLNFDNE